MKPETAENLPLLYVMPGCPWCLEVAEFLQGNGIGYREKNVVTDTAARAEMIKKSGQQKVPTLDWHGKILADFGVAELAPFLNGLNVKLEDS